MKPDSNIRITRRTEFGDRAHEETINIQFGASKDAPSIAGTLELTADADPDPETLVAAESFEMAEALASISNELRCQNTLDDMLHAIDALCAAAPPKLEWSPTLCDGERVSYAKAEKAVAKLNAALPAGAPKWRIPERLELESILDLTRHDPAVDTTRFPDTKSGWYWTSTPCAFSSVFAWYVSFGDGNAGYNRRGNGSAFVRAVRSLPPGQ